MKKLFALLLTLGILFSFAACGKENDGNEKDQVKTDTVQSEDAGGDSAPTSNESREDNSEDNYEFDITEDDHTVVIKAGKATMVYTHDGENVTGLTVYTELESAAEAKEVVKTYDLTGVTEKNEAGIISVTAKGKYLVIEYSADSSSCAYSTYEELHNAAEIAKQALQQNNK